ncbi:MAG: NAD(P)H-binding protein [Thiotrichales bacterium]|nr:NAD(P)H-binding protein [Thiotrichales bacterium]
MLGNKVTVFGGTGFVGRAVVNQLSKAGYHIQLVVRRPERFREFALYPNCRLVALDSFDNQTALVALLRPTKIVVNLIADRTTGTEQVEHDAFDRVSLKLKTAMESAGVERVLSLSQIGASTEQDSHCWLGALANFDNHMNTIANAKVTVLKAGLLIGEQDDTTQRFIQQLQRMPVLMLANANTEVQPLWVKDFAKALVAAIDQPAFFGKKIDVAGSEAMRLKDLGRLVADLMQAKDAVVFPMCRLNARIMAALGALAPVVSVSKSQLLTLQKDATTDQVFADHFGFEPMAIGPVIADYAQPKHQRERYNRFRQYANRD